MSTQDSMMISYLLNYSIYVLALKLFNAVLKHGNKR